MEIKTRRLILRDVNERDAFEFARAGNSKEISYFVRYLPYPLDEKKAGKMIQRMIEQERSTRRRHIELAITLKEKKKVIGMVNLYDIDYSSRKCKLGFWIGENYRRKGYTLEACKKVLAYGFTRLSMHKISASTLYHNHASNRLLKKLKFRKACRIKDDQFINKEYVDCYLWEKINKK